MEKVNTENKRKLSQKEMEAITGGSDVEPHETKEPVEAKRSGYCSHCVNITTWSWDEEKDCWICDKCQQKV